MASKCLDVSFTSSARLWKKETARSPGVWAHIAESFLSIDDKPSPTWKRFEPLFSFSHVADVQTLRRYPEFLSGANWGQFLRLKVPLPISDSGWLREAMHGHEERINAALDSKRRTFRRAAKSVESKPSKTRLNMADWTEFVAQCSPFDPRRSEMDDWKLCARLVLAVGGQFSL